MAMTNAEWVINTGHHFKQLRIIQHNELANRTYTVALCDKPIAELKDKGEPLDVFRKWLDSEHKAPILDDVEKRYLSAVIRPFRDNVKYIEKWEYHFSSGDFSQIFIRIENKWNGDRENMIFPEFIKGTMYKGMEPEKKYTLDELGL